MFVTLRSGSLKDVFDVAADLRDSLFAVVDLEESQHDDNDFNDEDEDADEDSKVTETGFSVVVATPSSSPIYDPNQIHQQ